MPDGDTPQFSTEERRTLRSDLLAWYDRHRRDLPWRDIDDPYRTWVAEMMLQQTQVATVVDYYRDWMERFPTVESVAAAEIDEILDAWEGLGYYRRARYLHRSANKIVDEYGGGLPETAEELENLIGVGPYTAGAIASIAFGEQTPLVDGNVSRVLSRLRAIAGDPKSTENKKLYWALAETLVPPDEPGDFNQAMMELGATICTPESPNCLICPVRDQCRAFEQGTPEAYPDTASRASQRPVRVAACVVSADCGGRVRTFVNQRPPDGLLGGLWEFPTIEVSDPVESAETLVERLSRQHEFEGLSGADFSRIGEIVHLFSHLRMTIEVWRGRLECDESLGESVEEVRAVGEGWLSADELDEIAMSAAMRRVQSEVLGGE